MKKKLIGLTGALVLALSGTAAQASSCGHGYGHGHGHGYTTIYYSTCNVCYRPRPRPCDRCSHDEIGFIWP